MNKNFNTVITSQTNRVLSWKTVVTTPATGETTSPLSGSMATPLPNIPLEKTSSSIVESSFTFPSSGDAIVELENSGVVTTRKVG